MVKRVLDIIVAFFAILILLPLMGVISLLVAIDMGLPVLFRQKRPGLHNRIFTMYKFRTMRNNVGIDGKLLSDGERLTRLGRLLRATSLDELPELFNVLKGEMSLVGPRPLLVEYLSYYTVREQLRHTVRPGITGYAQVNGRNTLPWDERLALDVWYVEHWSLWLDICIILKTIVSVCTHDGVVVDPAFVMMNLDEERQLKGNEVYKGF